MKSIKMFSLVFALSTTTSTVLCDTTNNPLQSAEPNLGDHDARTRFIDMVYVEGGDFNMGSNAGEDDEKPVHKVHVDGFYMDKFEVTNEQFCKFINENGNQTEQGVMCLNIGDEDIRIEVKDGLFVPHKGYENHPVVEVTWHGARAYAQWAGKRLPTEAEWEYAARGGNKIRNYAYSGGNDIDSVAWHFGNSGFTSHPVGTRKPNQLGLYDMSGNALEWCADWYDSDYYSEQVHDNPKGPATGNRRVLRGGSWKHKAYLLRCTSRGSKPPDRSSRTPGFRCAR